MGVAVAGMRRPEARPLGGASGAPPGLDVLPTWNGYALRMAPLPGTTRPQRFRPKFHYELLACGLSGHELVGTDAASLREDDAAVAREAADGQRWYRCLRCDSWLP